MIAMWFRVADWDKRKPTGYVGMVFGQNTEDCFWQIDQYCDPYGVEVSSAQRGSMCCLMLEGEGDDISTDELELCEQFPLPGDTTDTRRWRRPRWPIYGKGPQP